MIRTTAFFVLLLAHISLYGQDIKAGDYIPNSGNAKFVGTWLYTWESNALEITFTEKKKVKLGKIDLYTDVLIGDINLRRKGLSKKTSSNNKISIANGMADKGAIL